MNLITLMVRMYIVSKLPKDNDGYYWNPSWVLPFESEWGIYEKFLYLNGYSHGQMDNSLDTYPAKVAHTVHSADSEAYLSNLRLMESSDGGCASMQSYYYNLVSNTVRFCPECLKLGYHTDISQMLFIEKCPIHHHYFENSAVKIHGKYNSRTPAFQNLSDNITRPFHMIEGFPDMKSKIAATQFLVSPYSNVKALHINRKQSEMSQDLKKALCDIFFGRYVVDLISSNSIKEQVVHMISQFLMWRDTIQFSLSESGHLKYSDMNCRLDTNDFNIRLLLDDPYCILYCIIMSEYLPEYTYNEICSMESLINCNMIANSDLNNFKSKKLYFVLLMWHYMLDYREVVEVYSNIKNRSSTCGFCMAENFAEARSPFYIGDFLWNSETPSSKESSMLASIWVLYTVAKQTAQEIYKSITAKYWQCPLEFSISSGGQKEIIPTSEFLIVSQGESKFGVRIFNNKVMEKGLIA